MASNTLRSSEKESADDYGSEPYTSLTDELAAIIDLISRGAAGEEIIIQTLQRLFVPIFMPSIRQFHFTSHGHRFLLVFKNDEQRTPVFYVTEQIELVKQELLTCMKENLANKASTLVPKKLKLQFRNKISLPVFTGKPLLGENNKSIEIALVDALTGEIVNTGTESTAKLKIVGFRVGDNESDDESWTFEDFQNMIHSEKEGTRILQGNTCLQLKEGICFVDKVSFTHNSKNTKNGKYRLGVGVVEAALMNGVEVARTEAFLMKDARSKYSKKHSCPSLSDPVCHLPQIRYCGPRHQRMKVEKVYTVKDLLTLLYTDQKQLEDILELKASSKGWHDIVNNAQKSKGVFLYLDPSNKQRPGVVLDVKGQLKGLIVEPQGYIPVDQLSDKQKTDNQNLANSVDFKMLRSFEDETYLEKYLHTDMGFRSTSANQGLGTSVMIDGSTRPSLQVNCSSPGLNEAPDLLNNSNLDESTTQNGFNFGTATEKPAYYYTEPGTSSQAVETSFNTCENMNNSNVSDPSLEFLPNELIDDKIYMEELTHFSDRHCPSEPAYSDPDVMMIDTQTVSICTTESVRTRGIKESKLLRRKSVRESITLTEGIQGHKKQRYFGNYPHTDMGFSSTSSSQGLGTSEMIDGSTRPSLQVNCSSPGLNEALDNLNNSNLDESTTQAPIVTTESKRGTETVPFNDEMTYSMNDSQGHISNLNLESLNGFNFGTVTEKPAHNYTEPGTSSQAIETSFNTFGNMNNSNVFAEILINDLIDAFYIEDCNPF